MITLEINKEVIKNQAEILHEFLKKKYEDVKLTNCYEAIALMYNFKSWNNLSAYLKGMTK